MKSAPRRRRQDDPEAVRPGPMILEAALMVACMYAWVLLLSAFGP